MKRLFLLGQPIAHSLSPALHNAALEAMARDWHYELLEIGPAELAGAVARLREDDCAGANVTIPHKETIIPLLEALGESAREIGAVNTVVKRDGRLVGENTDALGFLRALADEGVDPRGARVALLGAGGAARAVGFALGEAGARSLAILNRTPERARALAADLARRFPGLATALEQEEEADLVVSAVPPTAPLAWTAEAHVGSRGRRSSPTSVARGTSPRGPTRGTPRGTGPRATGGYGVRSAWAGPRLAPGAVAYDLAYRTATTPFLDWAAARGARTANGLGMLVYQAAASLALWTGREVPVEVMFAAARRALKEDL